jgi:uncharacterized BrkB/YihY/UPF0761 family membrane protein
MTEPTQTGQRSSFRRRLRAKVLKRVEGARKKSALVDHLVRAELRFRQDQVLYLALVVTYRALFLSIVLMLAFLYVLGLVTSVLPGTNEIVIPIVSLPTDQDLGAIVNQTFTRSSGAVMDVLGVATLLFSATYTAKAMRQGTENILRADRARRIRTFDPRNLAVGVFLAAIVLLSWLLVLSTAIRRAAVAEIIGLSSPTAVNVAKGVIIVTAWLLIAAVVFAALRIADKEHRTQTIALGSAVFAAFVVAANFVLIYSYIAALVDPDTSGSVVVVLTILAWVNIVVRGLFYTQCWIAESAPRRERDQDSSTAPPTGLVA